MTRAAPLALLLLVHPLSAQPPDSPPDSARADTMTARDTSVSLARPAPWERGFDRAAVDTVRAVPRRKSPMGAFWRSGLVPGWGQLYNGSLTKLLAAFVAEGTTWAVVFVRWDRARDADRAADRIADSDSAGAARLRAEADHQRDVRNGYIWLGAALTLFWSFEAYVDAHLAGLESDVAFSDDGVRLTAAFSFGGSDAR